MKALLLAAAVILPPHATGNWVGETDHAEIVFESGGFYYYFGPRSGTAAVEANCEFTGQEPGQFGYMVTCTNGIEGQMRFFDTGVLEFDLTRFVACDPDGCPAE